MKTKSLVVTETKKENIIIIGLQKEKSALNAAFRTGQNALLIGETGTCKTSIVKALAGEFDQELIRINLDGGTSTDQLVGRFQVRKHAEKDVPETFFQEGALVRAMREGCILLLDEINAALADVLFVLHSILEQDARLFIPETGEEVIPHKDFKVVATMNPVGDYAGTRTLNHALYSRFGCIIRFQNPSGADVLKIMKAKYPASVESDLMQIAFVYEELQKMAKEDKINTRISVRECLSACALAGTLGIKEAIKRAMIDKLDPEESKLFKVAGYSPSLEGKSLSISELISAIEQVEGLKKRVEEQEKELKSLEGLRSLAKQFIQSGVV